MAHFQFWHFKFYHCINISVTCYKQSCFDECKTMCSQDDNSANNDSLCNFSCAKFRAILHQYRSKCKFTGICAHERLVCKSSTNLDIVKMEEQPTLSEKNN